MCPSLKANMHETKNIRKQILPHQIPILFMLQEQFLIRMGNKKDKGIKTRTSQLK